jgi:hypothetical protein
VKPDFFTSDDVLALTPLARLLYVGTWCEADCEGRLVWKPETLKLRYMPKDGDIDALCGELVGRGLVVLYGDGLAYIPTFKDHQVINPREAKSRLPEPPAPRVQHASVSVQHPPSPPSASASSLSSSEEIENVPRGQVVVMPAQTPRYMKPMGGKHGDCLVGCRYGMCLHEKQAMDLAAALPGGFSEEGLASVVKWAESVVADYAARGEGRKDRNEWRFWDNRWEQQWGGSAPSFGEMRAKRQSAAFGDEVVNG